MVDIVNCPICQSLHVYVRFTFKEHYAVVACKTCGLQFLSPQPSNSVLTNIYSSDYFLGGFTNETKIQVSKIKRATSALYLKTLSKLLNNKKGILLEIGCGDGDLLVEGDSYGFTVYGIEISPYAAKTANKQLTNPSVILGTSENIPVATNSIDICVLADVIEHVHHPIQVLQQIHSILKPETLLFIVTPSLNSWSAKLMKNYWMEYKLEHLFYFSDGSIRKALEMSGFTDIRIEPNYKVLTFDYIYNHFMRFQVPFFTPLLKLLHMVLPNKLIHICITVVASGMVVSARNKP